MPGKQVPLDSVKCHLSNTQNMYDLLARSDYFLPDRTASIITRTWLHGVRTGKYLVPKCHEVRVKNCVCPPTPKIVIAELQRMIGNDLGISQKKQPDMKWMLWVISSMN